MNERMAQEEEFQRTKQFTVTARRFGPEDVPRQIFEKRKLMTKLGQIMMDLYEENPDGTAQFELLDEETLVCLSYNGSPFFNGIAEKNKYSYWQGLRSFLFRHNLQGKWVIVRNCRLERNAYASRGAAEQVYRIHLDATSLN
eukprot:TRINITY_DN5112_c0_g1_i2.p1 TRINITY_DN5112_c0_g1~~TRINITY_DN5112_c0_g1_i2.p1  ORF type:complete len:142 (-),score=22.67 TRINITY_DN5112_c0_g1_i2:265-690(-)